MFSLFRLDRPKDSIVVLEGVRAIACLTVIWYHINLATKGPQSAQRIDIWSPQAVGPLLSELAHVGWCGVTLFFVLSGFLLFLPYARSMLFDTPWPGLRRFYLRRIFRSWPGYFASLALLILLAYPEYLQAERWQELLLFITFFMDSSSKTFDHLNGPYWTLAVEWQYYVLLPFLAWGMRWIVARGSLSRRLWMLGGCLLAMIAWGLLARAIFWEYSWTDKISDQPAFEWAQFFLYGRNGKYLEDFAVGMAASVIYVLAQRDGLKHKLVVFCQKYALWLWQGGLIWLALATLWPLLPATDWLDPHLASHRWLSDFVYALGFGVCILALLFGPSELRKPLEWGPLCRLGALSYALYIWHIPLLRGVLPYLATLVDNIPGPLAYGLTWLGISLIVVPFCYLFYCIIEQPWMQASTRLLKRR